MASRSLLDSWYQSPRVLQTLVPPSRLPVGTIVLQTIASWGLLLDFRAGAPGMAAAVARGPADVGAAGSANAEPPPMNSTTAKAIRSVRIMMTSWSVRGGAGRRREVAPHTRR